MEKYIAELAKQAEQLNSIRAILQFGVFTSKYDENFTILTMDEYFCEMLGYTQDELMEECRGKAGELIYHEDYKRTVSEIFRQCTTASEFSCQYRVRKKDGTLLWVWDSGVKKEDKNGGLIIQRVIANINDLVNLRKERDTAYENIPGGVAYIDIYENDNGTYKLHMPNLSYCLVVQNASTSNLAKIIWYPYNNTYNEQWMFVKA